MAGSYGHCVDESGRLLSPFALLDMLDTGGDVYEAVEELFGMVWFLAGGRAETVARARRAYQIGLDMSPGTQRAVVDD